KSSFDAALLKDNFGVFCALRELMMQSGIEDDEESMLTALTRVADRAYFVSMLESYPVAKMGPLLSAVVYRNDTEFGLVMLERGVNVNAMGTAGVTPLCAAVRKDQEGLVKVLVVGAGADVSLANSKDDETPLQSALER